MAKKLELSLLAEGSIKDPLLQQLIKVQRTVGRVAKNTANNSSIAPRDRGGLINALGDVTDQLDELGSAIEANINERAQMNEYVDEDVYERMDGLVSQSALKGLIVATEAIIHSLEEEGFDKDDIYDYIVLNVKSLGGR